MEQKTFNTETTEAINMESLVEELSNTLRFRKSDSLLQRKRKLFEYRKLVRLLEDLGDNLPGIHTKITLYSRQTINTLPGYTITVARFLPEIVRLQHTEYGRVDLSYMGIKSVELIIDNN